MCQLCEEHSVAREREEGRERGEGGEGRGKQEARLQAWCDVLQVSERWEGEEERGRGGRREGRGTPDCVTSQHTSWQQARITAWAAFCHTSPPIPSCHGCPPPRAAFCHTSPFMSWLPQWEWCALID